MPPQRVGSLRRFGLKKGIDFVQFVLGSSMVSDGTTGVHGTYFSFQFQMNKKEREICEFEVNFKKLFLLAF